MSRFDVRRRFGVACSAAAKLPAEVVDAYMEFGLKTMDAQTRCAVGLAEATARLWQQAAAARRAWVEAGETFDVEQGGWNDRLDGQSLQAVEDGSTNPLRVLGAHRAKRQAEEVAQVREEVTREPGLE